MGDDFRNSIAAIVIFHETIDVFPQGEQPSSIFKAVVLMPGCSSRHSIVNLDP
jgi:hypothetical protein